MIDTEVNMIKMEIKKPKYYNYVPKQDITVYELARIVPAFQFKPYDLEFFINGLDESCKRHFEEIR